MSKQALVYVTPFASIFRITEILANNVFVLVSHDVFNHEAYRFFFWS